MKDYHMSKYDALGTFLRAQGTDFVPMTFRQIEDVTGAKLPSSKRYPAWWSNNTWNNVMTKVWLEAGYRTEQVDIAGERLVFRRAAPAAPPSAPAGGMAERARDFHSQAAGASLFGALKGTFTIEPGWDPAAPALEGETLDIDRTADLIDSGFRGAK